MISPLESVPAKLLDSEFDGSVYLWWLSGDFCSGIKFVERFHPAGLDCPVRCLCGLEKQAYDHFSQVSDRSKSICGIVYSVSDGNREKNRQRKSFKNCFKDCSCFKDSSSKHSWEEYFQGCAEECQDGHSGRRGYRFSVDIF